MIILVYTAHIAERSKRYWASSLVIIYCQLYLKALSSNTSVPLNSKVFTDFLNFTGSPSVLISILTESGYFAEQSVKCLKS